MPVPPVLAFHLVLTCYGFWLPSDPRGSGSTDVWSEALKPFGPATKVTTERSVAGRPHDRHARLAAKHALRHAPVRLTGVQAKAVADGFGAFVRSHALTCLACSVLPDHAHLVITRTATHVDRLLIGLKAAASHTLLERGIHPHQNAPAPDRPKVFARGGRHRFLFDGVAVARAVAYARNNPPKHGFPVQRWSFVHNGIEPRTQ